MLLLYWSHVAMNTIPVNFLYFLNRFDLILVFHVYKLFFEAVAEEDKIFSQRKAGYNRVLLKSKNIVEIFIL